MKAIASRIIAGLERRSPSDRAAGSGTGTVSWPWEEQRSGMVEEFLSVVGEVDFAHRHQEVAVTAKPGHVRSIERDQELLGGL